MSDALIAAWKLPPASRGGDESECELCDQSRMELAKAHQLLRAIARTEAKPVRAELLEDPAECMIVGYAQAFAGIKARIELFLRGGR
jgi:hypothetical protein